MKACGVDSSGSEEGLVAGSCEHDKAFGSKKCELIDWGLLSFWRFTLLHGISQSVVEGTWGVLGGWAKCVRCGLKSAVWETFRGTYY